MIKNNADIVHIGPDRLRIGPWRGDPTVAFITPIGGHAASAAAIHQALDILTMRGFPVALTSALSAPEQDPFFAAGFTVRERLHLLRHSDPHPAVPSDHSLRRATPLHLAAILRVDALAFDAFWRLDRVGLRDARRATPSHRYRVIGDDGVAGYAITGRAGSIGYLQRLAVDPERQGRGMGTALVLDSLRWAQRCGARSVLVNTQISNGPALALYERLGFTLEPIGLAVLQRPLSAGVGR